MNKYYIMFSIFKENVLVSGSQLWQNDFAFLLEGIYSDRIEQIHFF